jgi:hypothetical protein
MFKICQLITIMPMDCVLSHLNYYNWGSRKDLLYAEQCSSLLLKEWAYSLVSFTILPAGPFQDKIL